MNQIEPWITDTEIREITNCIESTFVTEGKYTDLFEKEIQKLHQVELQPIAVANATMGIYSALIALGIKPGQEVIIPALTFVATANAVIMANGIPVCVDIDKNFHLDTEKVEVAITDNTFAIMPVHLYGHFTNALALREICKKNNLFLIEDASQGVGVTDDLGNYAGSVGDVGILSFYGNKFVTSAQGGMVLAKNKEILSGVKRLKNHGRDNKGTFWHEAIGYNFCISDLHSALGYAQLKRFEDIRKKKLQIFQTYQENLKNVIQISLDKIDLSAPCYWFISLWADDVEHLQAFLKEKNIQTRRAFPPLSKQPCYFDYNNIIFHDDNTSAEIYRTYLSLPSSAMLENADIEYVCNAIKNFMGIN
jgi:perosamine synthetase